MSRLEMILQQIEDVRKQMAKAALTKGITSSESIYLSQELDRLLNLYNKECYSREMQKK